MSLSAFTRVQHEKERTGFLKIEDFKKDCCEESEDFLHLDTVMQTVLLLILMYSWKRLQRKNNNLTVSPRCSVSSLQHVSIKPLKWPNSTHLNTLYLYI